MGFTVRVGSKPRITLGWTRMSHVGRWLLMGLARFGLLVALAGTSWPSCSRSDLHDEPREVLEYRGGPSSVVCGQRWSHDHESVYCDGRSLALEKIAVFPQLSVLHLSRVHLTAGRGATFPQVRRLYLDRVTASGFSPLAPFPDLIELAIDSMAIDVARLAELSALRYLMLYDVEPPSAAQVLACAELRSVSLTRLRCVTPGCALALGRRLKQLRPELEVRVDGRVLRP